MEVREDLLVPKDPRGRSGQEGVGHGAARGGREIPFSAEVRFVYLAKEERGMRVSEPARGAC